MDGQGRSNECIRPGCSTNPGHQFVRVQLLLQYDTACAYGGVVERMMANGGGIEGGHV